MRTTITPEGDRRGGVLDDRDHDQILDEARTILAYQSATLRAHIDALQQIQSEDLAPGDLKQIDGVLAELHKTLRQVLEMESKAVSRAGLTPALDLEAARAEIQGRLDRLALPGAA